MIAYESDLAAVREVEVRFLRHRCQVLEQLVRDLVTDPHNPETIYRARLRLVLETALTQEET